MKSIRLMILSALAASLLLLAVSCNTSKTDSDQASSSAPQEITIHATSILEQATVTTATIAATECETTPETLDEAAVESIIREAEAAASRAASATEEARKPSMDAASYYAAVGKVPSTTGTSTSKKPPSVQIQYQFVLRESAIPQEEPLELMCIAYIYAGPYTWTVEDDNGTSYPIESDSVRPCYDEKTSHLQLSRVADSDYIVDVSLAEKQIESYTLMAYSLEGGHYESGTPCTIRDGKLELFTTPHYYELTVQYTKGSAVYGFFVE